MFGLRRVLTVPLGDVGVLHIADGRRRFDARRPRARRGAVAADRQHRRAGRGALSGSPRAAGRGDDLPRGGRGRLRRQHPHGDGAGAVRSCARRPRPTCSRSSPTTRRRCVVARGRARPALERAMLDEAGDRARDPRLRRRAPTGRRPGSRRLLRAGPPARPADRARSPRCAMHGEPFARAERRSFTRMANVAALNYATELYQQQRAELARLQERQRLADDLHDDVAQILFAAQLTPRLDPRARRRRPTSVAERIARARGLLIRGDTAIRTVIHKLSQPARGRHRHAAGLGRVQRRGRVRAADPPPRRRGGRARPRAGLRRPASDAADQGRARGAGQRRQARRACAGSTVRLELDRRRLAAADDRRRRPRRARRPGPTVATGCPRCGS